MTYIAKAMEDKDCSWFDCGAPLTLVRWVREGRVGVFEGLRHGLPSLMQAVVGEDVEMFPADMVLPSASIAGMAQIGV